MRELTHERLKELLDYDPETGVFTWKVKRNGARLGGRAGYEQKANKTCQPHRNITVEGTMYLESHLAWFYMTHEWSENEIDHRDRNPVNNKWSNLRQATSSQNSINRGMRSDNTTGFKGVTRHRRKFKAWATINHKRTYLGLFDTPGEAYERYKTVMTEAYGEFVPWHPHTS